jgi:hypothetical protein
VVARAFLLQQMKEEEEDEIISVELRVSGHCLFVLVIGVGVWIDQSVCTITLDLRKESNH